MRKVDFRKREEEILSSIIESYIRESSPISSKYLCQKYRLPYSSATVRNAMERLEKNGYLRHTHTSSGRVPTEKAFKFYVEKYIKRRNNELPIENEANFLFRENAVEIEIDSLAEEATEFEYVFNRAIDVLAAHTHYVSLLALEGVYERTILRGIRFIFEHPEFKNVNYIKKLLYVLEEKIEDIHDLLLSNLQQDQHINILIGEDIGFEDISSCALIISGIKRKKMSAALAVLGPIRMDYAKAVAALNSITYKLGYIL